MTLPDRCTSILLFLAALPLGPTTATSAAGAADEDFETDALAALPGCPWLDVGQVPTVTTAPNPSATVVATTDADGQPTQALALVDAVADSQGIYRPVPVSSRYVVAADMRVDQLSDGGTLPYQEGAGVFVAQLNGDLNLCCVPAVGIYASSVMQGWRLYVVGISGLFEDIDLTVPVTIGAWQRVEFELITTTGAIRSRIWDLATDTLVLDQVTTIAGWTPGDGDYDILAVVDVEVSKESTIGNEMVFDNISYQLGFDEPCTSGSGDLDGDGDVDGFDLAMLLAKWTGSR
jgi:hypothetical protein